MGTGIGGSSELAGEVLQDLLPLLEEATVRHDVDIALVARSAAHLAAAQQTRRNQDSRPWAELAESLRDRAAELAGFASQGRLVLFLGAGVSAGAGLPAWKELLAALGRKAGLTPRELDRLNDLGELDRAEYLAQRLGSRERVGDEIAGILSAFTRYSLAHGLLASLPWTESVTTNYDCLFEDACAQADRPLVVLPYEPAGSAAWLLKMHGCLRHPEDIILTRQSYYRYAERNAALAGIVQTMLITRHMLFLGFSLADENFLRIADQVRRAARPGASPGAGRQPLGITLMLRDNPLLADLWRDEIERVCLDEGAGDVSQAALSRRFEIFLDYLAHRARQPSHLLDYRFAAVRTPADQALVELLEPLVTAPNEIRQSGAWPWVEALLRRLGGDLS